MTFAKYGKYILVIVAVMAAILLAVSFSTASAYADGWDGTASSGFSGGTGSESDPYQIASAGDFAYLANAVNGGDSFGGKYFSVTASEIDFNNYSVVIGYLNDNGEDIVARPYNGNFDGNGVVIKNLSFGLSATDGGVSYHGLFGYVGKNGTVKNVKSNVVVEFSGTSDGYYFGGIVGYNAGAISNCETISLSASGISGVGGICGVNAGAINGCQGSGEFTLSGDSYGGGIVAANMGTVQGSRFVGKINIQSSGSFGGIAATNDGEVSASYATFDFSAGNSAGGIVLNNYSGATIKDCFFSGAVGGVNYFGGIAADNSGDITNAVFIGKGVSQAIGTIGGITASITSGEVKNVLVSACLSAEQVYILAPGTVANGYYDGAGFIGEESSGTKIFAGDAISLGEGFSATNNSFPCIKSIVEYSDDFAAAIRSSFSLSQLITISLDDESYPIRKGLGTPLPAKERTGYEFLGWSDGTAGDYKSGMLVFESSVSLTSVFELTEISYVSISSGISRIYDGSTDTINASFSFVLTLTYEWYYSATGEENTFRKVVGATDSSIGVTAVADSGVYYCRASFSDGSDSVSAESDRIVVNIFKAQYETAIYPYGEGDAIDGGKYEAKTLSEYALAEGFRWAVPDTVPTVDCTLYPVFYNGDPDNYSDFAMSVNLTLTKGTYQSISYNYGDGEAIDGGKYGAKALSQIILADNFYWVLPETVYEVGKQGYEAYYNADSVNYNDYELTIYIDTAKGLYTDIEHPSLQGVYDKDKTLADYALSADFAWRNASEVPTVDKSEYEAYYNADEEHYENYYLCIRINVLHAQAIVNPIVEDEILYVGGNMPNISLSEGDTPGVVAWTSDELIVGTNDYAWTFIPTDGNYESKSGSVALTVYYKVLVGVRVDKQPEKTVYTAFQSFERGGMEVVAVFLGGKEERVEGYRIEYSSPTEKLVCLDKTVTIAYDFGGVTMRTTVAVTVNKLTVEEPADSNEYRYTGEEQVSLLGGTELYYTESEKGTTVGVYKVTATLRDTENYCWESSENNSVEKEWKILPALVSVPQITNTYIYTGKSQSSGISATEYYTVKNGYDRTDAGTYEIVLQLIDKKNHNWLGLDGAAATADITVYWTIGVRYVKDPTAEQTRYEYTGEDIEFRYTIFEGTRTASANYGLEPGTYEMVFSLKNKNYVWNENETQETRTLTFVIEQKKVAFVAPEIVEFVYSGLARRLELDDTSEYTVTGQEQTAAGEYEAEISLRSKNYIWADGTTTNKTVFWRILKKQVKKPTITEKTLVYNGQEQVAPVEILAECVYTDASKVSAGTYSAKINLADKNNYEWSDGGAEEVVVEWSIERQSLLVPTPTGEYRYTGETVGLKLSNAECKIISGGEGCDAKIYQAVITLPDSDNYVWSDGSYEAKTLEWQIKKMQVEIPTIARNGAYNGYIQTAPITESKYYSISGNKALNAGEYTVTVTLNDKNNCEWSDGSTGEILLGWTINKASVAIPEQTAALLFSGENQKAKIAESDKYVLSGNYAVERGNYTATATIIDFDNYCFSDGSEKASVPWSIFGLILSVDGEEQTENYTEGTLLPVPQKEGYSFAGWYLTEDFSSDAVTSVSEVSGDVRLYARWVKEGADGLPADKNDQGGFSDKAIVGLVVLGVCVVISVVVIIIAVARRKKPRKFDY